MTIAVIPFVALLDDIYSRCAQAGVSTVKYSTTYRDVVSLLLVSAELFVED